MGSQTLTIASADTQTHLMPMGTLWDIQVGEPATGICISWSHLGVPSGSNYTQEMAGSAGPKPGKTKATRVEEAVPPPAQQPSGSW